MPAEKVELGFDDNAPGNWFVLDNSIRGLLDNSTYTLQGGVFYDVTQYITNISVARGKNRELDRFNAGHFTATFKNRNRYFDPTFTGSPFYGQIVPRRAIRYSVDNIVQFTGVVDDWDLSYTLDGNNEAQVSAYDGFTKFANQTLTAGTATSELSGARINKVLSDTKVNWGFANRNIAAGDEMLQADVISATQDALQYINLIENTEAGMFFIDKSGNATWKNRNSIWSNSSTLTTRTNLVTNPSFETGITGWINGYNSTPAQSSVVAYTGSSSVSVTSQAAGSMGIRTNSNIIAGLPNTTYVLSAYVYSATVARSVSIYLYGYASNGTTATTSNVATATTTVGGWTRISVTHTTAANTAFLQPRLEINNTAAANEVHYFDAVLLEQSSTLGTYFDGSSTSATYDYYWTGTNNGSTSVESSRNLILNAPIIADDGSGIPYTGIQVVYGSELLYNQAILSRLNGGTATGNDPVSQAAYGVRSLTQSGLLHNSDAALANLAAYTVNLYRNPEFRFEQIDFALHDMSVADRAKLLNLEIGDVVQIKFTPANVPPTITKYAQVIGTGHSADVHGNHTMSLKFQTLDVANFVLNDVVFGLLDLNLLAY